MDWELNRAYARAIDGARDPVSLQRTQEDWRRHVRDACDNVPCVQNAYDRRTTELEAMAKRP